MNNNLKTFFFLAVLSILLISAGGMLGGAGGAFIAFLITIGINFYSWWYSDKLVLKRYRAHEVTGSDKSFLYPMVEKLATKANLPMPKVYIIPERTPNAFATGRNPENAVVAVTEGILEILSREELEGVIAHELAHIKNRDTLTSTIAATLVGALTLLGQMGRYGASGRNRNPLAIILIIILPLAGLLIRMLISRTREYEADKDGAEISGQPLALANALNKLHHGVAKYPISHGNPADSHLFIINPFLGGLQSLLSTHPPMEKRLKRLEDLARMVKRI
jgi:heat shock protein HtpX